VFVGREGALLIQNGELLTGWLCCNGSQTELDRWCLLQKKDKCIYGIYEQEDDA